MTGRNLHRNGKPQRDPQRRKELIAS